MDIQTILEKQREYFGTGATLPVDFRLAMLKKLYAAFMDYSCMLVEINPLVINQDDKLVAL